MTIVMELLLLQLIIAVRNPLGTAIFLFITHFADALSLAILTTIFTLWLLWRLQITRAIILAAGMIFSGLLTQFLKLIIARPRPNLAALAQDGFSFPSGHALGATVFLGFLLFIILQNNKSRTFPGDIRPRGKDFYDPSSPWQTAGYSGKVRDKKHWIKLVFSILLPLLILAIGFSRVYLGVHWVSDVIGGWIIGGLILAIMIRIVKYIER